MKWRKTRKAERIGGGEYTLVGTHYGVASMNATDEDGEYLSRIEWAVVRTREIDGDIYDGDNLDWFDTMREARADAEKRAREDGEA